MKKRKPKPIVMWIAFLVLFAVIVYDIWASMDRNKRETVSEMITRSSMRYPVIPFVAGFLSGHFWYSQKNIWRWLKL